MYTSDILLTEDLVGDMNLGSPSLAILFLSDCLLVLSTEGDVASLFEIDVLDWERV